MKIRLSRCSVDFLYFLWHLLPIFFFSVFHLTQGHEFIFSLITDGVKSHKNVYLSISSCFAVLMHCRLSHRTKRRCRQPASSAAVAAAATDVVVVDDL